MGSFARDVRFGKIAGPHQRKFKRNQWGKDALPLDADEIDKRLSDSGLFFHELLSSLRAEIRIKDMNISVDSLALAMVGLANGTLYSIDQHFTKTQSEIRETKEIFTNRILQDTINVHGNEFSPDELLTGVGDALKHVFRELVAQQRQSLPSHRVESFALDDLASINSELNKAILYQVAVEMWLDCVGHEFFVKIVPGGICLSPENWSWDEARAMSAYRRNNLALQYGALFFEFWRNKLTRTGRRKMVGMKMPTRVYGADIIERIDIDYHDGADSRASASIGAKILLEHGCYKNLLDEPLPKLEGICLKQIIDAWRFLQALSQLIFDERRQKFSYERLEAFLSGTPQIQKRILVASLARSLKLSVDVAEKLIDFLTFSGNDDQELWSQPLVRIGEHNLCLVLPCICSIQLTRVVERWMRQGGIDLEKRGPEFEKFCIAELQDGISESTLSSRTILPNGSVTFATTERSEEIDVVLIIGRCVLLLEAKCTLWPDDTLQYANHRDTIRGAVTQIKRKLLAVQDNYEAFQERLSQLGFSAPENPILVCGVITNSAIYAGFEIEGVPIFYLGILCKYFEGHLTKFESRSMGRANFKKDLHFYSSPDEAEKNLVDYLYNPPQLADPKNSIKRRTIVFPMESDVFGKLFHEISVVEVDERALFKKYGIPDEVVDSFMKQ